MLLIDGVLISDDVLEEHFFCKLDACKGACCYEGDYGAPLEDHEVSTIEKVLEKIDKYLPERSKEKIAKDGVFDVFSKEKFKGTQLHEDGSCVFLFKDALGIAKCAFEQAYYNGEIEFKKPISCHLYPVRVTKNEKTGFEAINYNRWSICNAACQNGAKKQIPLFRFLKEALTRKYGEAFYNEMDAAYIQHYQKNKNE